MKQLISIFALVLISLVSKSQAYIGMGYTTDKSISLGAGYLLETEAISVIGGVNIKTPFKSTELPRVLSLTTGVQLYLTHNEYDNLTLTPRVGVGKMSYTQFTPTDSPSHPVITTNINKTVPVISLEIGQDFSLGRLSIVFERAGDKMFATFRLSGFFR